MRKLPTQQSYIDSESPGKSTIGGQSPQKENADQNEDLLKIEEDFELSTPQKE